MNNNEKIEIGAVAKPQGIKGELKVRLFADDFAAVKDIKTVEINSIDYTVASFRHAGGEEAVLKRQKLCRNAQTERSICFKK